MGDRRALGDEGDGGGRRRGVDGGMAVGGGVGWGARGREAIARRFAASSTATRRRRTRMASRGFGWCGDVKTVEGGVVTRCGGRSRGDRGGETTRSSDD